MDKKIAYLSSAHFADCDLPLLHELQQQADVTYILQVSDHTKCQTLIDIKEIKRQGGVFPATDYPDLQNLSRHIDLSKAYVLNMPGKHDFSPGNLWAFFRLYRFLKKNRFSVLQLTWPLRYGAFMLYLLRRRMCLTMHDPLPHSNEDTRLNRLHRKAAIRWTPHFILLNRNQREAFIQHYQVGSERVHTSQLSIYAHLLDTRPERPESEGYVLFIGRIGAYKGVDYLCQAMLTVHEKHPAQKLIVAGSGKLYFDIEPYKREGFLELHNQYLTSEQLVGFISNAAFVVCPYIDATQSGVIMSAFALGKPVIATDTGGLPEMVEDGRHGLIVPPKDSEALAKAIEKLIANPQLLQQMHDNIIADYHQGGHSWHSIAADYMAVYNNYRKL